MPAPANTTITTDLAQLQRQMQNIDTAIRELNSNVQRLTALVQTIIDLNNLKSKR